MLRSFIVIALICSQLLTARRSPTTTTMEGSDESEEATTTVRGGIGVRIGLGNITDVNVRIRVGSAETTFRHASSEEATTSFGDPTTDE
ncbi:hypothetical protein Aduo_000280 [Ancylostoma duodenale]